MCQDIKDLLNSRYDRDTLKLQIPQVFDQLKASDAAFEMVTSNTLQRLVLICQKNAITHSYGVIFHNDSCKDLMYKRAHDRCEAAKDLVYEQLHLDECDVYKNKSKKEIISILKDLKQMARDFSAEEDRKPKDILQICIIWIGFCLDSEFEMHKKIIDAKEEPFQEEGSDQSRYYKWLELTCEGEPICINEYATLIA